MPLNVPLSEQPKKRQFPQTSSRPQWEQPIPARKLIIFIFNVLIGFTVVSIGARALAQHALPPANPFVSYADILPGQFVGALKGRGFSCVPHDNYFNYFGLPRMRCALDFTTGMFSRVWVIISSSGMIEEANFILRDDTFRVGDLVLLLGAPFNRDASSRVDFYRDSKYVVASTGVRQPSPLSPLLKVTFTTVGFAS